MRAVDGLKRVVIVGGGTAGWMTAAAFSKALHGLPLSITLIESDEIGTVGVGEATIPAIHHFNAFLGLNQADFMRHCQATFKLGIEFINWGKVPGSYIHPFTRFGLDHTNLPFHQMWMAYAKDDLAAGRTTGIEAFSLACVAARKGLFAHPVSGAGSDITRLNYAFHFDASLYARYLRSYAETRGVTRVEGKIVDARQNVDTGFVTQVVLSDGRAVDGDFFIDCSGFRGLLIEQALKTGYEDWTHWLPADRAIAVPSDNGDRLLPLTQATTEAAGWRWSIPLQHRRGNGYVFSSQYLTEDAARETLLQSLPAQPQAEPRTIRFVTGKRKAGWNRNVVAVGLSSGFLEPLESTSIHLIQAAILRILAHFPDAEFSPADVAAYNRETSAEMERVRDFVILHYKTAGREDTSFWRYCRDMSVPDSLSHAIEAFKSRGRLTISHDNLFSVHSWLAVLLGQGILPSALDPLLGTLPLSELNAVMAQQRGEIDQALKGLRRHEDYLDAFCRAHRVNA
ncbi:tryptophan halogenase family protein [Asticcacaulis machinosus]|uniref:Tryptophan 7-halogenase n=1 Tax=Asticcacaulis machinosus TaxID=2984211 RepID=A0ABT5HIV7_9CAUL|nr:tryptophan halogenase family protein [Asticcacaulis machinosus]MDC7676137.1 tryptophan 7-halogenase [Asticcacaulis machinosus]